MYSLGINMAIQPYGFSVVDVGSVCIAHTFQSDYARSESMSTHITSAMATVSLSLNQLTSIGVVVGPGQYTGIRMGVTMAKTMAMGLSIPLVGMTSFEALLYPYLVHSGVYLVCLPARKDEYNVQLFSIKNQLLTSLTDHFSLSTSQLDVCLNTFNFPIYVVSTQQMPTCDRINKVIRTINASDVATYAHRCVVDAADDASYHWTQISALYSHSPI